MILAIDTSAGTSVAVVGPDGGVLAEHAVDDTRRHAEVIGTLISACLDDSGTSVGALGGVAVGMGPGPFTGLRVGIAAANAFAIGAELPVLRVVSHDALAFEHYAAGGEGLLLVTTDARRREVYWSAYRGADELSLPVRAAGPGLAHPEALADAVPGYADYRRRDEERVSAASVGLLAVRLRANGRELAGPEPLYLRSPDVTLAAAPKRVGS
jgi:tRNA threonylcarbamoyl adenosine modification protein YeaZ